MNNVHGHSIKLASTANARECIRLSQESWPDWWAGNRTLGIRHIRERILEKRCLIVIVDNRVIAFLVWGSLWNKIHLEDIFVDTNFRRRGLAMALVERAIAIAKKQGYREVMSDCDTSNTVSVKFHKRLGFRQCGTIAKNWDDEDSVVFFKKI